MIDSKKYKKIGAYRLLPAGTYVWTIALQEQVCFQKDMIVEVTNLTYDMPELFFGKIKMAFFEHYGIPGYADKADGELGSMKFSDTKPYKKKTKPVLFEFSYDSSKKDNES